MTTPNMGLTNPVPLSTPGPDYAQNVSGDIDIIDAHNHSPGLGALVPTAGIGINADLPFAGYSALNLQTGTFFNRSAATATVRSIYVVLGDLYYTDGSGNEIQLTKSGTINVSAIGTFTNLGGTTGAATYNSGAGSFTFTSNTNVLATVSTGPIKIGTTVTSAAQITVQSPTLTSGAYTITLPAALVAADSGTVPAIMTMSATGVVANSPTAQGELGLCMVGNLIVKPVGQAVSTAVTVKADNATVAYTMTLPTAVPGSVLPLFMTTTGAMNTSGTVPTASIADGAVTYPKLAAVNYIVSSFNSNTFTSTSGSFVSVQDGSGHDIAATIVASGVRPIMVMCRTASTSVGVLETTDNGSGGNANAEFQFLVTGTMSTTTGLCEIGSNVTGASATFTAVPPGTMNSLFIPSSGAGSYTFTLQGKALSGSLFGAVNVVVVAYEL